MKKKNTTTLLIRNIIWALVIFVLCAMPGEDIPDPQLNIPYIDKIVHFGMFFVMAVLLCNELEYQTRLCLRKIFLLTMAIVLVYGGVIELLQHYFFNRSGDIFDLLADVAGGMVGCLFYLPLKKLKNKIMRSLFSIFF